MSQTAIASKHHARRLSAPPQPGRRRVLAVAVSGLNAWLVTVAFPGWMLREPTMVQYVTHLAPLALLAVGCAALGMSAERVRRLALGGLAGGVPVLLALAIATRDEAVNEIALPGVALLWSVMSVWVFAAAVAHTATSVRPLSPRPTSTRVASVLGSLRRNGWAWLVWFGAAVLVTVAPRWLAPHERAAAWSASPQLGGNLTVAFAMSVATGMLVLTLAPQLAATTVRRRPVSRARIAQAVVLGAIGVTTYWLTRSVD